MSIQTRIEKMEANILPQATDKETWISAHWEELNAQIDALWPGVVKDFSRFLELLRDGGYIPGGNHGNRLYFWPPQNKLSGTDLELNYQRGMGHQIDSACQDYFWKPDGGNMHAQPGEVWFTTVPTAVAFLEEHAQTICGWVAVNRLRESVYYKSLHL